MAGVLLQAQTPNRLDDDLPETAIVAFAQFLVLARRAVFHFAERNSFAERDVMCPPVELFIDRKNTRRG